MERPVTEEIAAIAFAKAWNRLDYSLLESIFSDEIIYESQMVLKPLIGKKDVCEYLKRKMETINQLGDSTRVYAELGKVMGLICVIVAQGTKDNLEATVLFKVRENRLLRIDICIVPHPSEAIRFGVYPT